MFTRSFGSTRSRSMWRISVPKTSHCTSRMTALSMLPETSRSMTWVPDLRTGRSASAETTIAFDSALWPYRFPGTNPLFRRRRQAAVPSSVRGSATSFASFDMTCFAFQPVNVKDVCSMRTEFVWRSIRSAGDAAGKTLAASNSLYHWIALSQADRA